MTQPREALLARFRAGLLERVRTTQRLVDAFQSTSDPENLCQALGELHTLKGESRMLGLSALSELAHALETELGTAQRFSLAEVRALRLPNREATPWRPRRNQGRRVRRVVHAGVPR